MTTLHIIATNTPLEDKLTELQAANDHAMTISRRGLVAMLRPEYEAAHADINRLLDQIEAMV